MLPTKKKPSERAPEAVLPQDEPLLPNINHINRDLEERGIQVINASGIDAALAGLDCIEVVADTCVTASIDDRNPEKRLKAAYASFEQKRMPQLKEDFPNFKRSQLKDKLYKEWKKSPENPMNTISK